MLSPLSRSTQIPIKELEKKTIIDYINSGGSVIMMVDEESHRVIIDTPLLEVILVSAPG